MIIKDVVDYVYKRKDGTHLQRWNYDQIISYILDHVKNQTIRTYTSSLDNENILAVVLFNPSIRGNFWIEQIWSDNKQGMVALLQSLKTEYPLVRKVYGQRTNARGEKRVVRFKVESLDKVFFGNN